MLFDYKGYSRKIEALGLIRKNPDITQDFFKELAARHAAKAAISSSRYAELTLCMLSTR